MIGRSIAGRVTLVQQALALFVIAAFSLSALALTGRSLLDDETSMLRNVARRGAAEFDREAAELESIPVAARAMLSSEPASHVRMLLLSPYGDTLGASVVVRDPDVDGAVRPARRARPETWHEERATAQSGVVVVASVETGAREATLRRLSLVMLWIALPLMVIVYLITGRATRRALRPLLAMTQRVADIPANEPRKGVAQSIGLREIDALSKAFNELLVRLDEQMTAERRFTAEASHELRTPLTALSGELELALADPGLTPPARESLTHALTQAHQMHRLVEALLLLRRLGDPGAQLLATFEPVNVADLVREAGPGLLSVYPGREADLQLELPDEVMVSGHPILLNSAIGNLLENALKFTRGGQAVRVGLSADGGLAHLVVEDAGPGIPAEVAPRIFEPFFRSPEARATTAGFGMGLPILKRVLNAHRGDVSLEASPLGGARFVLHLPLWASDAG